MTEPHASATTTPVLRSLTHWQRVSPIALLYFALRLIKAVFGNLAYLAPTLLVFYQGIKRQPGYFALGLLALIGLLLLIALLRYLAFRFRVHADTVEIRSGVLRKTQLNLPFSRIQNVRLLQPLYYRPTGHLCLQLDTAGSRQQEAQLAALPKALATELQQAIYTSQRQQAVHQAQAPAEPAPAAETSMVTKSPAAAPSQDEQLLCQRSVGDLVLYGISNNRVLLALGLAAPFYNRLSNLAGDLMQRFGLDIAHWFNPEQQSWFWLGLAVLTLTLMIMLLITLFSIAAAVLSYYGFTLTRSEKRYIRRSGLFTRHEISMRPSRLQWLQLQQDWLDKLFGRCNLYYEQVQSMPMAAAQGHAGHGKIMVPALQPEQAGALMTEAMPDQNVSGTAFSAVNWRFLLPSLLLFWLPALGFSQWALRPDDALLANLLLPLFALLLGLLLLRWRRFGYAVDEHYFYLRRGVIGVDYYCLPLYKLQQLSRQQHWLMRRAGLMHLQLVFASGSLTVPYMPAPDADKIANTFLYHSQSSGKGWM
ncbi:PH domain-containing protein [Alkalimonas sp. NCh-2]|uniref:PH domain-containing protein n=1 Tax=Alkalimonas sp. NCh-2 TaxID=3144846 RepID=UPI0031F67E32